jgi:hypothetical protein
LPIDPPPLGNFHGGGSIGNQHNHYCKEEFIPSLLSWIHTTPCPSVASGALQHTPRVASYHGSVPHSEAATHPSLLKATGIPTPHAPQSRGIPHQDVLPPPPPRPSIRACSYQNTAAHRQAHTIVSAQSSCHLDERPSDAFITRGSKPLR